MKFKATLQQIIIQTKEVNSYRFPKPEDLTYNPGQYMIVTLKSQNNDLMHPLSFSSSPTENHIEFTKRLSDSPFSETLKNLKPNDQITIDAPYGQFTFMGEHPKICLIAGGIGITPFRSIIKYATDKKLNANITLLYWCRDQNQITFLEDLNQMQNQNSNLKLIYILSQPSSDWKGQTGQISLEKIKELVPDYNPRIFFACGPPGMVLAAKKIIEDLGLPSSQLKLEALSGY
jgi:ferredoxin-NADP reductase